MRAGKGEGGNFRLSPKIIFNLKASHIELENISNWNIHFSTTPDFLREGPVLSSGRVNQHHETTGGGKQQPGIAT